MCRSGNSRAPDEPPALNEEPLTFHALPLAQRNYKT